MSECGLTCTLSLQSTALLPKIINTGSTLMMRVRVKPTLTRREQLDELREEMTFQELYLGAQRLHNI